MFHSLLLAATLAPPPAVPAPGTPGDKQSDLRAIERTIQTYNEGLTTGDLVKFRSALRSGMFMFNGAYSSDPTEWQAHMYVSPDRLEPWMYNYVIGAGPHRNRYKILSINMRANGSVVTTEESGENRYRKWQGERVTWMVGKGADGWKVIGYFIRDIRNP